VAGAGPRFDGSHVVDMGAAGMGSRDGWNQMAQWT